MSDTITDVEPETRARNFATELSKAEFAQLFGLSESQLERHFQQGMPHEKRGRRIFVPMPQGRVWYHEFLVEKGKKLGNPSAIDEIRHRREAAQAEMAELDLAQRRGQLVRVSDVEQIMGDAFSRVRAKLINLPSRIAGVVLGAESIQEAKARVDPVITEAMEELRASADVPGQQAPAA